MISFLSVYQSDFKVSTVVELLNDSSCQTYDVSFALTDILCHLIA
jgi:hypothetical protein